MRSMTSVVTGSFAAAKRITDDTTKTEEVSFRRFLQQFMELP